MQNDVEYPSPYDYSIYTDYLKALQQNIPPAPTPAPDAQH